MFVFLAFLSVVYQFFTFDNSRNEEYHGSADTNSQFALPASLLPVGTEEAVAMINRILSSFSSTLFGGVARR